jgi:hypothetical protein
MRLSSHDQARRALASLINQYRREELPAQRFRDLVYGFSKLLEYFRHDAQMAIEARLDALEERLERGGK